MQAPAVTISWRTLNRRRTFWATGQSVFTKSILKTQINNPTFLIIKTSKSSISIQRTPFNNPLHHRAIDESNSTLAILICRQIIRRPTNDRGAFLRPEKQSPRDSRAKFIPPTISEPSVSRFAKQPSSLNHPSADTSSPKRERERQSAAPAPAPFV